MQCGIVKEALYEPPTMEEALSRTLRDVFRHREFRAGQEEVCRAVFRGEDALLVMPTGAGKSLCYQLPAVARGGTALVVSPLLSLIEDQVMKLRELGLVAERIHSGLDRAASRVVCRRYLDGELGFLFIAPERLSVPGFAEMLARRPLSLIAIDEAHCISQWGHDFRPEYRMLGGRLPGFRPAPVLALTATATPEVQDDIAGQLGLSEANRFIQGFRRRNLHIEALPVSPGRRGEAIVGLLQAPERRPAIVYANSRRDTESLAQALSSKVAASAYHAGLPKDERERVQNAFVTGEVQVVVATVAFGMGIDKANVRTVVHAGLPASVEGYYQEIGRAGRDGESAHAVLLYGYADQKTHEFLLSRSYPEANTLKKLFGLLRGGSVERDVLRTRFGEPSPEIDEVFERTLEQLWVHGAVAFGEGDEVSANAVPTAAYTKTYEAQRNARFSQLRAMAQYSETSACRMMELVRYFGDTQDAEGRCGCCDTCLPEGCIAQALRVPSATENQIVSNILGLLDGKSQTLGQIHRALTGVARETVVHLVDALARANIVTTETATFEKDGERISFVRVRLVPGRASASASALSVRTPARPEQSKAVRKREKPVRVEAASVTAGGLNEPLMLALKTWRRKEAQDARIPAFRVFSDRVLTVIANNRPTNLDALGRCHGVGPRSAEKYGAAVLAVIDGSSASL
jgi:DNA topoisomerase III